MQSSPEPIAGVLPPAPPPDTFGVPPPDEASSHRGPPPLPVVRRPLPPAMDGLLMYQSHRSTYGELWRDLHSPLVLLSKLLHIRLPGSGNDPNVESLAPYRIDEKDLPDEVRSAIEPEVQAFASLGFTTVAYYGIVDLIHTSRLFIVTLREPSGRAVARVHQRTEGSGSPPRTHLGCDVLSEVSGEFLWTTSASSILLAPPSCRQQWMKAATPRVLWSAHEAALAAGPGAAAAVTDDDAAVALVERHHAAVRDFHLGRGVFRRMTEPERQRALALNDSSVDAVASGARHPDVLTELHKIQNKSGSLKSAVVVLVISALAFLASGAGLVNWDWKFLLLLLPILFFHEMGHYVAMKVFGYRNLRMFFIPFLGAAVSGQNYNAPGWKKVIVFLLGPLPGIAVGIILGIMSVRLDVPILKEAAIICLVLNGLNLLPLFPLDGGRVLQVLLFSRHPLFDATFRLVAIGGLIAIGVWLSDWILMGFGGFLLLGIPLTFRVARTSAALKREGFSATFPDNAAVPPGVAEPIIDRLVDGLPARPNAVILARQTLQIVETLNARPPGWLPSLGFAAVHAGAFILAAVGLLLLIAAGPGLWGSRGSPQNLAVMTQPIAVDLDSVQIRPPKVSGAYVSNPRTVLAAYDTPEQAAGAFAALDGSLPVSASAGLIGSSVLVALDPTDAAGAQSVMGQLAATSPPFLADGERHVPTMALTFVAADAAEATTLVQELTEYGVSSASLDLIPPWQPDDRRSPDQKLSHRRGRRTYVRLDEAMDQVYKDPRLGSDQSRSGDKELSDEDFLARNRLYRKIEQERIDQVRGADGVDAQVIDGYVELQAAETDEARLAALRKLSDRMGGTPLSRTDAGIAVAPASRIAAHVLGPIDREGLTVTVTLRFTAPLDGLPAAARWLRSRGCTDLRFSARYMRFPENLLEVPD